MKRRRIAAFPTTALLSLVIAISAASARTLRSPIAGIGTELLAHREKIEVTRNGSPSERSPVPIGRAHCHQRARQGPVSTHGASVLSGLKHAVKPFRVEFGADTFALSP